jgi:hypothetical protein
MTNLEKYARKSLESASVHHFIVHMDPLRINMKISGFGRLAVMG